MTDKPKFEPFTEDEEKQVRRMLNATLDVVFMDLLSAGEDKRKSIPVAEVVEVCLDADYLEVYGPGGCWTAKSRTEAKPLLEKFRKMPYAEQKKVARKAFPFKRYSL